jgi:peroxiredoxin (alkyl hydroperoxide reductase subunit C)
MPAVVGQPAPDFKLRDQANNEVSLADFKGQKSILVFIPFPFTGICDAEACAIRDDFSGLQDLGAKVAVITVHARPTIAKWVQEYNLPFAVLADYWPHGATAQAYGAFNEALGMANRSSYVLDAEGVVREIVKSDQLGQAREYEAYKRALAAI